MSDHNARRDETTPIRLQDALRRARIEAADRSAVVVDLRDAEVARLEIINEALDPLFKDIPDDVEIFDRGISQGDTPRLWIDIVAHIVMGRDKRLYRFVQDSRFGRIVLAQSHDVRDIVQVVTDYVARRMIEREHSLSVTSLASTPHIITEHSVQAVAPAKQSASIRIWTFAFGFLVGVAALFGFALITALRLF